MFVHVWSRAYVSHRSTSKIIFQIPSRFSWSLHLALIFNRSLNTPLADMFFMFFLCSHSRTMSFTLARVAWLYASRHSFILTGVGFCRSLVWLGNLPVLSLNYAFNLSSSVVNLTMLHVYHVHVDGYQSYNNL